MIRQTAVVAALLFFLSPTIASALVCPTDCASTCVGGAVGDAGVDCKWDSGGCMASNCSLYQIGICPTEDCSDVCGGAPGCDERCRSKADSDCQFYTTCGDEGHTPDSCNVSDGWYPTSGNYACCSGNDWCLDCEDQEYRDYVCNSTVCEFLITSSNTSKNNCSTCDDGEDQCTTDYCLDPSGCQFMPNPDGDPCDDGDVCTLSDECQAGVCTPFTTEDCDDGDTCTDDSCDPVMGCQNVDNMTCVCTPGDVELFYTGPGGTSGVGICIEGERECDVMGQWVITTPDITPQGELDPITKIGGAVLTADFPALCDGIDQDCNGAADDFVTSQMCYPIDPTGLHINGALAPAIDDPAAECQFGTFNCTGQICLGAVTPQPEVCDGLDNDCDGVIDNGTPEVCDGIDNDCDGLIDEEPATTNSCSAGETCHSGTCFQDCATTANCMGMEVCYVDDYRCDDPSDPCTSITCPPAEACYQGTCFISCSSDAFCDPTDEQCFDGNVCLNSTDPCENVQCPDFQVCYAGSCFDPCSDVDPCDAPLQCWDGRCADVACDKVLCPLNEDCYGGSCFQTCIDDSYCDPNSYCFNGRCSQDACDGVQCPDGQICHGGSCFDGCAANAECAGDTCFDASFCSTNPCDNVQCGTSQQCYGGSCFDTCADSSTCESDQVCYASRCVSDTDPYCDKVLCGEDQTCVSGTCFDNCTADDQCNPDSYCYQGACVQDTCAGVSCLAGETCFRGVCFPECDPTNPCEAPDGCFDGRCAASACEAMALGDLVAYNDTHPFRDKGHKLVATQRSKPWLYPRPIVDPLGQTIDGYLGYSGNSTTAPISAPKKARIVFFRDENESGNYVLYLTHGANNATQGEATATWNLRFDGTNPDVLWMDDPDAEGYKITDSNPRHIVSTVRTGAGETGGIAIGFLPADQEWTIKINGSFHGDIDGWEIYNGESGEAYELDNGSAVYINSYEMPDSEQFSPEVGTPCTRDDEGICAMGTYLECVNSESICYQTVAIASLEVCDGVDNTCNGLVDNADPSLEFPMAYWKQGHTSGYQVLATYDGTSSIGDLMNYTPSASDDRLGYTNVQLPDGTFIQEEVDQAHLFAYRDLNTGNIYFAWAIGKDSLAADYGGDGDTYGERNIEMDFDESGVSDLSHVYVSWYDDRAPGMTADKVLDEYNRDIEEIDFRFFLVERDGRTESDAAVIGNDWRGSDLGINAWIEYDSSGRNPYRYYLHRPSIDTHELEFGHWNRDRADIYLRIIGKKMDETVCESDTATPSGCQLSRYACVGGETVCQLAVDPACSTCFDLDGDGFYGHDPTSCPDGNDCDDEDPSINPGNPEICNGIDDNCDGLVDIQSAGCPGGAAQCGPQECNYAISCQCPDGAELPETPGRDCFCGSGISE